VKAIPAVQRIMQSASDPPAVDDSLSERKFRYDSNKMVEMDAHVVAVHIPTWVDSICNGGGSLHVVQMVSAGDIG
jgi:hypothetical protein